MRIAVPEDIACICQECEEGGGRARLHRSNISSSHTGKKVWFVSRYRDVLNHHAALKHASLCGRSLCPHVGNLHTTSTRAPQRRALLLSGHGITLLWESFPSPHQQVVLQGLLAGKFCSFMVPRSLDEEHCRHTCPLSSVRPVSPYVGQASLGRLTEVKKTEAQK